MERGEGETERLITRAPDKYQSATSNKRGKTITSLLLHSTVTPTALWSAAAYSRSYKKNGRAHKIRPHPAKILPLNSDAGILIIRTRTSKTVVLISFGETAWKMTRESGR